MSELSARRPPGTATVPVAGRSLRSRMCKRPAPGQRLEIERDAKLGIGVLPAHDRQDDARAIPGFAAWVINQPHCRRRRARRAHLIGAGIEPQCHRAARPLGVPLPVELAEDQQMRAHERVDLPTRVREELARIGEDVDCSVRVAHDDVVVDPRVGVLGAVILNLAADQKCASVGKRELQGVFAHGGPDDVVDGADEHGALARLVVTD